MLLVSATIVDSPLIRVTVHPSAANGFRKTSQVMVDKAMSVKRDKLGPTFGRLEDESMLAVNRSLAVFLSIL